MLVSNQLLRLMELRQLERLPFSQLALWLTDNFTPAKFKAGDAETVECVCVMLFNRSYHTNEWVTEFIARLWGTHGELPMVCPHFDSYGRFSHWKQNAENSRG